MEAALSLHSALTRRGSRVLLNDAVPRTLIVRSPAAALREIVNVIALRGVILIPRPSGRPRDRKPPRLLSPQEIEAIPILAMAAARLPRELRLVVALWADEAAIITANYPEAGAPPADWLERAHFLAGTAS